MKSALVIGPTSMLGARLVELLHSNNYTVYTCGRSSAFDVFVDLASDKDNLIPLNIKADVMFHCAAAFQDDSFEGCLLNEKVNALGSYQVARIASTLGCKFVINAGTISSYTTSNNSHSSSYGGSKARGEQILEWALGRECIGFASLRFPQLYDEYGLCRKHQAWFCRIIAYASAGKNLRIPGGSAKRNFLHVLDAASLMLAAAEEMIPEIFPVSNPISNSYQDIAKIAFDVFSRGGTVEIAPEKAAFREVLFPESSLTYKKLNYSLNISILEGIQMIKDTSNDKMFGPLDVK